MYTIVVDPVLALAGFAVLAVIAGVWAYQLGAGVPFRPVVAALGAAFCLGLFFLVESGSWYGLAATAPLDLVLLVLAGLAGATYAYDASRIVRFPDGRSGYRSRAAIPLAWFLLLSLTVATEVIFLGQVTVLGVLQIQGIPDPASSLGVAVGAPGAFVVALVDALFAVSTGLILGQSSGVHARLAHHRWVRRAAAPTTPATR
jgi:hypothetical protein